MKSEVQALHKRAPLKESTHGTFLKNPFPLSARHFAYGEMANALSSRSLPWSRVAVRVTAARLVARLVATHGFPLPDKKNSNLGLQQSGELRAVVTLTSVRVIGSWRLSARSGSFAPPWAKEPRRSGRWILKEETVGFFLTGRSFGPFLSPWRERDITHQLTAKLQFEIPTEKLPVSFFPRVCSYAPTGIRTHEPIVTILKIVATRRGKSPQKST